MRILARETTANLVCSPGSTRPIRLRMAGSTLAMERAEAIELAAALVAAVDELDKASVIETAGRKCD